MRILRARCATRGHHIVPRCKGGRDVASTCHSCGDFIHKTWSHNELRDTFNSVEKILSGTRFQRFLRWLYKQQSSTVFRTRRNRSRRPDLYKCRTLIRIRINLLIFVRRCAMFTGQPAELKDAWPGENTFNDICRFGRFVRRFHSFPFPRQLLPAQPRQIVGRCSAVTQG